jgi:GNAT superfamily N-acetyltransferase
VIVRAVRRAELPIAAALYERVGRATFTWILPAGRVNAQDFIRAARSEEVYVAVQDAEIIGLATLYRAESFLHSLYVSRSGQGTGKALLDHVAALADGPLWLRCQAANLRAQAFYRREGFSVAEAGGEGDAPWLRMVRAA